MHGGTAYFGGHYQNTEGGEISWATDMKLAKGVVCNK